MKRTDSRSRPRSRRGTVYVLVLTTAATVSLMGLAGYHLTRNENAELSSVGDAAKARLLAQSALQIGVHRVTSDPSWRTSLGAGEWITKSDSDTGSMSLRAVDPVDDDTTTGDEDPLVLIGSGMSGSAVQRLSLKLQPISTPVTSLETAITAGGGILASNAILTTKGSSSCDNLWIGDSKLEGTYEIQSLTELRSTRTAATLEYGEPARTMPGGEIVTEYAATGTRIPASATNGGTKLELGQFGPGVAPAGIVADENGVYVIDCSAAADFEVSNIRLTGTLVFINVQNSVIFRDGYNIVPARPGGVVVMADGPVVFSPGLAGMLEATLRLSLNGAYVSKDREQRDQDGPGTAMSFVPIPWGGWYKSDIFAAADADTLDFMLTFSEGVVFSSGWIGLDGTAQALVHWGPVITPADVVVSGNVYVGMDEAASTDPPELFEAWNSLAIVSGSLRRHAD